MTDSWFLHNRPKGRDKKILICRIRKSLHRRHGSNAPDILLEQVGAGQQRGGGHGHRLLGNVLEDKSKSCSHALRFAER
jgi:hypothetical protein